MESYLEDHLAWRPITRDELPELLHLRMQLEQLDDSVVSTVERVVDINAVPDLESMSIGGWDNYGNLLAFGLDVPLPGEDQARILLLGGVHPTHRYLKIGRSVLKWQQDRAVAWRDAHRPHEELWLGCYTERHQPGLRRILERSGYQREREFHDMFRSLENLPRITDVDGVEFTRWDDAHEEEVRLLHERCFAGPNRDRIDPGNWHASFHDDGFRPEWSWLALKDGIIVGYALARADDDGAPEGERHSWTDRLGVAPEYRGQGISTALLVRGLHSMAADGCSGAGIGVDSPAHDFLRHLESGLGYRTRDAITLMSKTIPAG